MEFYQLKTLTWIDFNFNRILGGTLPDELCDLTQLQRLYIGFTDLRGNIPACINRLAKLEILFVSMCKPQAIWPLSLLSLLVTPPIGTHYVSSVTRQRVGRTTPLVDRHEQFVAAVLGRQ